MVLVVYSEDGRYLATTNGEQLRVWEVSSNSLHQEFSGGSEISCIQWKPLVAGGSHDDMWVCGGVREQIMVWSLLQGQHTVVMEGGHSGAVSCLCWSSSGDCIISGGEDGHLVQWSVDTGELLCKWKGFKSNVYSVCCHGGMLLSASRMVKVWQISDQSLLKRVSGHASPVRCLLGLENDLFLSAANSDRTVNIWRSTGSVKTPVCSLVCEEDVVGVAGRATDSMLRVAVLCEDGKVHLFQMDTNKLGGKTVAKATSVTPDSILQYVSTADKVSSPTPLPILGVTMQNDILHLCYGSTVRPVMETVEFDVSQEQQCFVRSVAATSLLLPANERLQHHQDLPGVRVVGPGNMAVHLHDDMDHRPLTARMAQPEAEVIKPRPHREGRAPPPSTESVGHLVSQAVTSGDDKLLEEVLKVTKEKLVSATVKKLPVNLVVPFMRKLIGMLRKTPSRALELSIWMRVVITCHAAYLISVPDLSASVGSLYEVLETRVSSFSKLSSLQGKLNLLIAHAAVSEGGVAQETIETQTTSITLGENCVQDVPMERENLEEWNQDLESDCESDSDVSMDS